MAVNRLCITGTYFVVLCVVISAVIARVSLMGYRLRPSRMQFHQLLTQRVATRDGPAQKNGVVRARMKWEEEIGRSRVGNPYDWFGAAKLRVVVIPNVCAGREHLVTHGIADAFHSPHLGIPAMEIVSQHNLLASHAINLICMCSQKLVGFPEQDRFRQLSEPGE